MTDTTETPETTETQSIDQAVAAGGAYEVLRRRLSTLGGQVQAVAEGLNAQRLTEFGDSQMALAGRFRIRSENNAVGRDIMQVGELTLFGFNVHLAMKTSTSVADVFGLYRLVEVADGYDVEPVPFAGTFLDDPAFVRDFTELYAYYKDARLLQLVVKDGKLLAAFQIGARSSDMRVFRWSLASSGEVSYIDARGERDIALPAPFDFEWIPATREMQVSGRHPHLNILDTLFVETTGGDLTIKVENNTDTGKGIHAEPVEDSTQSIDDASFAFARLGALIVLKVQPYREPDWRGFVYNTITGKVVRNDAILQACVQLPEDHGIIFPGGCYLQNGQYRAFDAQMAGMQFKRAIRSPNGEDVLYIFYERETGQAALFVYNMIQRELANPVYCHGYARLADGRMVLFTAEGNDPTRVHPMQVWITPFVSDEFAASVAVGNSFMGRLGNAEMVRGISNLLDLTRSIESPEASAQRYELLTQQARRLFDTHHWIDDEHCNGLRTLLHDVVSASDSVLDEFEKVQDIRAQSSKALAEATTEHRRLMGRLQPEGWSRVQDFVEALNAITAQRGHLLTIREYRYIDTAAIDAMAQALQDAHAQVGAATGRFLASDKALAPLSEQLDAIDTAAQKSETARQLADQLQALAQLSADLDMLSELMATLAVDDATERTRVVEAISNLYARLNQIRARADQKRRSLGSAEAVAQFSAQFALLGQGITSALGLANTPERADEQLSRLLVQLEELEGQFGEHDEFLGDIIAKREELLEVFESHKQALLDTRQRQAQSVYDAAMRILEGLGKRAERFQSADELNAFFVGDALILKLRELSGRLRELKDAVKADDIEARLKATRDQAVRGQRDRSDLFEDGGNVIRMGPRHRFSVNTQPLDLTLLPRGEHLAVHLTGTDYMQPLKDDTLDGLRAFWQVTIDSESPEIYRGEYLAGQVLRAAQAGEDGLDMAALEAAQSNPEALNKLVSAFAAPRYREGYERGIHDHDAALILARFLPLHHGAGSLIHPPQVRAEALLFWLQADDTTRSAWRERITNAAAVAKLFGDGQALSDVRARLASAMRQALSGAGLLAEDAPTDAHAAFLAEELQGGEAGVAVTRDARLLLESLKTRVAAAGLDKALATSIADDQPLAQRYTNARHWLAPLAAGGDTQRSRYVDEAAALLLAGDSLPLQPREAPLMAKVEGLLGEHPRIEGGHLSLVVDDFLARLDTHERQFVPAFHRYQQQRQAVITEQREQLRLGEYQARPLTSFVRNKLINDVYLPIIGDNLAKQMGTVGDDKRTDLMGLLMMISPPGYGKTTLMEYVAARLGLVFMKINGPALGHNVHSLDPAQAPDATSRQELEKLNLGLEMGSNVMLYVDDIQHTHPEFLQKFISLTDGTRRIEGVWQGRTKTYDMRGKKFAVVMAGNPYTESGEVFKIPDMLANRADIYNLGDVLGGMEDTFLLSYIENSLTSNPVLAPLATRPLEDLYLLVDKARGREVSTNNLSHSYSAAEIGEITATLQRLMQVRDIVYRVNQQYIASAAQDDRYRTEPPFKLQGSYRNMNKLAEKISPVMNEAELQQLIDDHYLGESQLLTTGAEENLLKLAELRGVMSETQTARWTQIKADFLRNKAMGGDDMEVGPRVVAQLADIASGLQGLGDKPQAQNVPWEQIVQSLQAMAAQRQADAQAAPVIEPSAPSDALLREAMAPVLQQLAQSQNKQGALNEALVRLADVLNSALSQGVTTPVRARKPVERNPKMKALDDALETVDIPVRPQPRIDAPDEDA